MVDWLFSDLRFNRVLDYIDDILVHSSTFEKTFSLLRTVLNRLRDAGLTLNLPKSVFFPRKLKYLGQYIENGRLIPDEKKVDALRRIKNPINLNEVRSLLGFLE